jgi:hypothetical protein
MRWRKGSRVAVAGRGRCRRRTSTTPPPPRRSSTSEDINTKFLGCIRVVLEIVLRRVCAGGVYVLVCVCVCLLVWVSVFVSVFVYQCVFLLGLYCQIPGGGLSVCVARRIQEM